jgi:hypothetical protein
MSAAVPNTPKTPGVIDAGRFTRTQVTALKTCLDIQRAGHVSTDYKRHLTTLVLRTLTLDDLSVVIEALLATMHLAVAKPQAPKRVVA